jgi:hypothetical protein
MTMPPAPPCSERSQRFLRQGVAWALSASLILIGGLSACQESPEAAAGVFPVQEERDPDPQTVAAPQVAQTHVSDPAPEAPPGDLSDQELAQPGVVSEAALRAAPTWILDPVPILTIGLDDGPDEYMFGSIAGLAFLPDGRIAVADLMTSNIRVYSGTGVFSHSFGRDGEGPGEFRRLSRLGVLDNGYLAVFDRGRFSIGVFTASGTLEQEWRADACFRITGGMDGAPAPAGGMMASIGPTPSPECQDSSPWFLTGEALLFPAGAYPDSHDQPALGEVRLHDTLTVALTSVTPEGAVRVASMEGSHWIDIGVPREDYSRLLAQRLFGGEPWFAVRAPWLVYGNSGSASIRAVRYDTGEDRVISLDALQAPVTRAAMDSVRARIRLRAATFPQDRWNRYTDRFLELSGDLPAVQPAFTSLMMDADHRVWVGDYLSTWTGDVVPQTEGRWWTVLTLDGQVVARAHVPARFHAEQGREPMMDIRDDRVLVRMIDPESGVHRAGVFRLRPG